MTNVFWKHGLLLWTTLQSICVIVQKTAKYYHKTRDSPIYSLRKDWQCFKICKKLNLLSGTAPDWKDNQDCLPIVLTKVIGATPFFISIIHQDNTSGNIHNTVFSHTSEIILFHSTSKMTVVCLKAELDIHFAWTLLKKTSHSYTNKQLFSDFCGRISVQMHVHMQTAPMTYPFLSEPDCLISS